MPLRILAPAKLNLTLDIVGRRPDGYHLLESVMQTVSWYDELEMDLRPEGIGLECGPELPDTEANLAYRAAKLFLTEAGLTGGARIRLEKRIPMGAGMGGGSADAAGVLAGMNALYRTGWPLRRLMALGERLGADVPFCLHGGTALVQGIGERIEPLPALPSCVFLIVKPPVFISTRAAFAAADRGEISTHPDRDRMCRAIAAGDLAGVAGGLENVFEQAAPVPAVTGLKRKLLTGGAMGAAMTGSGSAVFGIYPDPAAAEAAAKRLSPQDGAFACAVGCGGPCLLWE